MSIPMRLSSYLEQHGALYDVCTHGYSRSSAESARTAGVPAHQLAKSVLIEDESGCLMAVIPADKNVMLGKLAHLLGRKNLCLANENRIAALFDGCDRGAVPPFGMAWGVETIVDEELESNDIVYVEAGDHEHLLRMSRQQFQDLMSATRHGHFCRLPTH
ncbi:MAG TPA: YbaK/EbsC family protein [Burkholderiaceae bacterium]|nr:YbaK/EbsC family protein [Burkholderiaceae bacterium]